MILYSNFLEPVYKYIVDDCAPQIVKALVLTSYAKYWRIDLGDIPALKAAVELAAVNQPVALNDLYMGRWSWILTQISMVCVSDLDLFFFYLWTLCILRISNPWSFMFSLLSIRSNDNGMFCIITFKDFSWWRWKLKYCFLLGSRNLDNFQWFFWVSGFNSMSFVLLILWLTFCHIQANFSISSYV